MTIKYTVFKNVAALDKAIVDTCNNAKALREAIQDVAVGILQHAYKHGDYSRAEKFVTGLGEGVRQKALVDWFVQFGGLIIAESGEGFSDWKGKEFIKANFDQAKAKGWWTCKPEKPFEGFNLDDALDKLIAKAEKALKQANDMRHKGLSEDADKVKVEQATLDALRKLKASK